MCVVELVSPSVGQPQPVPTEGIDPDKRKRPVRNGENGESFGSEDVVAMVPARDGPRCPVVIGKGHLPVDRKDVAVLSWADRDGGNWEARQGQRTAECSGVRGTDGRRKRARRGRRGVSRGYGHLRSRRTRRRVAVGGDARRPRLRKRRIWRSPLSLGPRGWRLTGLRRRRHRGGRCGGRRCRWC